MTEELPFFHCTCCNALLTKHEVKRKEKYCSFCLGDSTTIDEDSMYIGEDDDSDAY